MPDASKRVQKITTHDRVNDFSNKATIIRFSTLQEGALHCNTVYTTYSILPEQLYIINTFYCSIASENDVG